MTSFVKTSPPHESFLGKSYIPKFMDGSLFYV